MENRFGFKELVISTLLVVVIVMIFIAMRQYDRQWTAIQAIQSELFQHATVQTQIQREVGEVQQLLEALAEQPIEPPQLTKELLELRAMLTQLRQTAPSPEVTDELEKLRQRIDEIESQIREAEQIKLRVEQARAAGHLDAFHRIKAAQQNPDYALGDWYVDVFSVVPDRLTPLISADAYGTAIQGHILESLATRDYDTLEWKPLLATHWTIDDRTDEWHAFVDARLTEGMSREQVLALPDLPDAVVITFDIRRGVTFSDGQPLTADDVVFTFDWVMNPQVEAVRARIYLEKIRAVKKLGPYQVAFHFREPYFQAFEQAASMDVLPKHFYSRFSPSEFNRAPGLLLGSGPYRLSDPQNWRPEPGVPIQLLRNNRYWGEPAPFDRMIWRIIENDAARLTTFRNRDSDAFFAQPEQYDTLRRDREMMARSHAFAFQRPNAGYVYIAWNQQRNGRPTIFADKRVRQAMTMLIDRERIIREVYLGYGMQVTGPFGPTVPQSNKSIEPWPFDPSRAAALLREAGFEDRNGDGVLEGTDGRPLRFSLNYPTNNEIYNRLVLFIKDTFARSGVVVDAQPLEWSVLLQRVKLDRDFDAVSLGWTGAIEGDPYQIFHSRQIAPPGDNSTSYSNPELDRLIERARSTVIEEERMPLWHQVHAILHEDQPYTFLFTRQTLAFVDGRFKNVKPMQLGFDARTWYVPRSEQRYAR